MIRSIISILFSLLLLALPIAAKPSAPDWLANAAKLANPPFDPDDKPEIVVLVDEGDYELKSDGRLVKKERYAIRILDHAGKSRAKAQLAYYQKSTKVNRFNAWTIDREGDVYAYKKNEIEDRSQSTFLTYKDSRLRTINGSSRSIAGTIFGYEYEVDEATIFSQGSWHFNSGFPVVKSRLSYTLPKGWTLSEKPLNGAPKATIEGSTYTWQMTNCPILKPESNAPKSSNKASTVSFDVYPPEGEKPRYSYLSFRSWADIANYKASVQDPNALPNEAIIVKAQELTKNSKSIWEKVQAIGEFTKDFEYVSINYNLALGGGYEPRNAAETFALGYGDCKDKTAVMRALLRSVGINSYGVSVNATNNDAVNLEWPTTHYFNHCIVAVVVDESVNTPATLIDPEIGRILFVDPTWPNTAIGELPFDEQGGYVVLSKPGLSRPVRLPQSAPADNLVEREILAEIVPNGGIIGRISNRYRGEFADDQRSSKRYKTEAQFLAGHEKAITNANKGAVVKMISYQDNDLTDRNVEIVLEMAIPNYGQSMRDKLLVFKPAVVTRQDDNPFDEPKRTMPIKFQPRTLKTRSSIYVPEGYAIDDAKKLIEFSEEFGSYKATTSDLSDDGMIVYERSVVFNDVTVPASDYAKVQAFYHAFIEADQTPVVLARIERSPEGLSIAE